jgi:hypothetical protein
LLYVAVVAEPSTFWLLTSAQQIVYEAMPDLSRDALHASETVYAVTPVTWRFVGVVGADLSAAYAVDCPASMARIRIAAPARSPRGLAVMALLPTRCERS